MGSTLRAGDAPTGPLAQTNTSTRSLAISWLGRIDYREALEVQRTISDGRLRDAISDSLLLLEHPHVYTLGRGADERFVLNPGGIPVHRVSRGGQVTYHGPGQLVGYPIIKLEGNDRDVILYLRRLEQVLIESLATLGIVAQRRAGLTGVWVGQEKIASIGVGFRRWVSLHGFALNVTTDLNFFDAIVPCGIAGCRMTSIERLGVENVSCQLFAQRVAGQFARVFGYQRVQEMQPFSLADLAVRPEVEDNHGTKAS